MQSFPTLIQLGETKKRVIFAIPRFYACNALTSNSSLHYGTLSNTLRFMEIFVISVLKWRWEDYVSYSSSIEGVYFYF
jgi:hypothetical protein